MVEYLDEAAIKRIVIPKARLILDINDSVQVIARLDVNDSSWAAILLYVLIFTGSDQYITLYRESHW